jgi:hypothetical protein
MSAILRHNINVLRQYLEFGSDRFSRAYHRRGMLPDRYEITRDGLLKISDGSRFYVTSIPPALHPIVAAMNRHKMELQTVIVTHGDRSFYDELVASLTSPIKENTQCPT